VNTTPDSWGGRLTNNGSERDESVGVCTTDQLDVDLASPSSVISPGDVKALAEGELLKVGGSIDRIEGGLGG
jgi:hypothetical protein